MRTIPHIRGMLLAVLGALSGCVTSERQEVPVPEKVGTAPEPKQATPQNLKVNIEHYDNRRPEFWYQTNDKGEKHGLYICWYQAGDICCQGHYVNGEQHGPWTYYWSGYKLRMTGAYAHGEPCGEWRTYTREGGVKAVQHYFDSGKELFWEFHGNGHICELSERVGAEYHGEFRTYHENGALRAQGSYRHGKKVGTWRIYDVEGKLLEETKHP